MDTIYEQVKKALQDQPSGRLRAKKNKFIAWLLWRKYKLGERELDSDLLEILIVDGASYDRAWRKVLEDCPELRGTDYGDKTALEQEKMLELGYEPGSRQVSKKIKRASLPYKDDSHETHP